MVGLARLAPPTRNEAVEPAERPVVSMTVGPSLTCTARRSLARTSAGEAGAGMNRVVAGYAWLGWRGGGEKGEAFPRQNPQHHTPTHTQHTQARQPRPILAAGQTRPDAASRQLPSVQTRPSCPSQQTARQHRAHAHPRPHPRRHEVDFAALSRSRNNPNFCNLQPNPKPTKPIRHFMRDVDKRQRLRGAPRIREQQGRGMS